MRGLPVSGAHLAAVDERHPDLAAVEIGARSERVGDQGAVRGHRRLVLVAVRVECPVADGQAPWPRVRRLDHGEPGCVIALDRDEQAGGVDPDRAGAFRQPAWRPARGRDEPDVAAVLVGDGGAVRGQARLAVLPERRRSPTGRQALGNALLELGDPDVGGLAVADEQRGPAIRAERERVRALRRRHGLEPPLRRRR